MKIIDLSVTISTDIKEPLPTSIVYEDHKEGAKKMGSKYCCEKYNGSVLCFEQSIHTFFFITINNFPVQLISPMEYSSFQ